MTLRLTKLPTPLHSRFLNPEISWNCANLQPNVYYCVEAVGSLSTYPGYVPKAKDPFIPTNMTSLPWRNIMDDYKTTNPVIPFADGTRTDCYQYGFLYVVALPWPAS